MAVRRIDVREKVMAKNDELATAVRTRLSDHGVPSLIGRFSSARWTSSGGV